MLRDKKQWSKFSQLEMMVVDIGLQGCGLVIGSKGLGLHIKG
jgi:hypothetical protein